MRRIALASLVAAASACSLAFPVDDLSRGAAVAAEAGIADASPLADARADATVDAAVVNLQPNGGFEDGVDPWGGFNGVVSLDTTARTGTYSLRTCNKDGNTDNFSPDDLSSIAAPEVGATYRATAWVRSAPNAPAPEVKIGLRTVDTAPSFTVLEEYVSAQRPLDATWRSVTSTLTVTKPAQRMGVYLSATAGPGVCFLTDDVVVEKL